MNHRKLQRCLIHIFLSICVYGIIAISAFADDYSEESIETAVDGIASDTSGCSDRMNRSASSGPDEPGSAVDPIQYDASSSTFLRENEASGQSVGILNQNDPASGQGGDPGKASDDFSGEILSTKGSDIPDALGSIPENALPGGYVNDNSATDMQENAGRKAEEILSSSQNPEADIETDFGQASDEVHPEQMDQGVQNDQNSYQYLNAEGMYNASRQYGNENGPDGSSVLPGQYDEILLGGISADSLQTGNSAEGSGSDDSDAWYASYEYCLDDPNQCLILTKYHGSDEDVSVPSSAVINGVMYRTLLEGNVFEGCGSVQSLAIEPGCSLLENGEGLFSGMSSLQLLDLTGLDTSRCVTMARMFEGCTILTAFDAGHLNTENVQSMHGMFRGCSSMANLNLSAFHTQNVRDFSSMFEGCSGLPVLDLSSFDFSSAESADGMMENCSGLYTVIFPVQPFPAPASITGMLRNCTSLAELDLTNFCVDDRVIMCHLVEGDNSLRSIRLGASWRFTFSSDDNGKTCSADLSDCSEYWMHEDTKTIFSAADLMSSYNRESMAGYYVASDSWEEGQDNSIQDPDASGQESAGETDSSILPGNEKEMSNLETDAAEETNAATETDDTVDPSADKESADDVDSSEDGEPCDDEDLSENVETSDVENPSVTPSASDQDNKTETVTIEGNILWDDHENEDGLRPKKVKIYLMTNGETIATAKASAKNSWAYRFSDLSSSDSTDSSYTVSTDGIDGYETRIDGYTITNTHTITRKINGSISWNDAGNADKIRPKKTKVTLYGNGKEIAAKTVKAKKDWAFSFRDLPKYSKDGKQILYTLQQNTVKGYSTSVSGYDILNTHHVENRSLHESQVISVSGRIIWDDSENEDRTRPASLTVLLLQDGRIIRNCSATGDNNWAFTFANLPKQDASGKEVNWTVDENIPSGYRREIRGYEIINIRDRSGSQYQSAAVQTGTPVSQSSYLPASQGNNFTGTNPYYGAAARYLSPTPFAQGSYVNGTNGSTTPFQTASAVQHTVDSGESNQKAAPVQTGDPSPVEVFAVIMAASISLICYTKKRLRHR